MNLFIKPHIKTLHRYQTSIGRDLVNGVRLDRNEKVSSFPKEVMEDIFGIFENYSLIILLSAILGTVPLLMIKLKNKIYNML